jgi:hypothetical protein
MSVGLRLPDAGRPLNTWLGGRGLQLPVAHGPRLLIMSSASSSAPVPKLDRPRHFSTPDCVAATGCALFVARFGVEGGCGRVLVSSLGNVCADAVCDTLSSSSSLMLCLLTSLVLSAC